MFFEVVKVKLEQCKSFLLSDGFDSDDPDHHFLLKGLAMTAADLSDQAKDFHNSKVIAVSKLLFLFYRFDLAEATGLPMFNLEF